MSDEKPAKKTHAVVELEEPLVRGEQSVAKVTLRKPTAGDFRGTTMAAAYQMDPVALSKVISRISDPTISAAEYLAMDADDAAALGGEVVDFLLTKREKARHGLTE